ncbi:MAG: DUF998 domain-containing protein, partial [Saprospiraceae bacterium]
MNTIFPDKQYLIFRYKILGLLLVLAITPVCKIFCQEKLPILHSNKLDIKIKFNEDPLISWHIEPEKNPDVFQVGSTLKSRNVKFITDVDSMAFELKPGQIIDFIILLNGTQECHTRIQAMPDPIFLQKAIGIPVFITLVLLAIVFIQKRKSIALHFLLKLGFWAPVLFWITTIIAGFLHGNYNHFKMTVSELGTIGTGSEIFFSITLFVLAILCFLFSFGFYKMSSVLKINNFPAILSFSMCLSIAWAAIFPSGHELHGALGPLPLILIIGVLIAVILWKDNKVKSIRYISILSF